MTVNETFDHVVDSLAGHEARPRMLPGEGSVSAEMLKGVAEQRAKLAEARWEEEASDHPRYANAIVEWLSQEVSNLAASGAKIDDETIAEAELLDKIIAEFHEDEEERALVKLAEARKSILYAQIELDQLKAA